MNTTQKFGQGFTLVELVVAMVIIGILAAFAVPRFSNNQAFSERGYADEISSALRNAQKIAVASGCNVRVDVTPAGYQAMQRANAGNHCAGSGGWSTLVQRADGSALSGQAPSDAAVTGTTQFEFNAAGQLQSAASTLQIGPYTVTVDPISGFVEVE